MTELNTDIQTYYDYYCDGSCHHVSKDNWMGIGVYMFEMNTIMPLPTKRRMAISAPRGDHNIAEYLAILCALTDLYIIEGSKRSSDPYVLEQRTATIHSDSQLIIRQITGEYKAKKQAMQFLLKEVKSMVLVLNNLGIDVEFTWVSREIKNQKVADWLSKVGNKYFKHILPDDTINHGITEIEEMLLPNMYRSIRKKLHWPHETN